MLPHESPPLDAPTSPAQTPSLPLSRPLLARKREDGQEGYLVGWALVPLFTSPLCRCEKNEANVEGPFSSSSLPGQSLRSGCTSGLKDPMYGAGAGFTRGRGRENGGAGSGWPGRKSCLGWDSLPRSRGMSF